MGSEPLDEPCLGAEGRLRQKGDVDLLAISQLHNIHNRAVGERTHQSLEVSETDLSIFQLDGAH